jgi:predicted DNA-binding transcriptional regulator YafY
MLNLEEKFTNIDRTTVMVDRKEVNIDYTDYKGVRSLRRILPVRLDYGKNQWHKENQYMIVALDLDRDEIRTFSIKDIHKWTES